MKDYLICIDSDGCAIDSMDIKHFKAFGPLAIREWGLEEWSDELLAYWNQVNLYSMTRGINRFLGLEKLLVYADEKCTKIEGLVDYRAWCASTPVYSPASLPAEGTVFVKARHWSDEVNRTVASIDVRPFNGVRAAMEKMGQVCDIAIVSSANTRAVEEEWTRFGLMPLVSHFMSQDDGTKKECIAKLLGMGYRKERTIMIGDAPGDLDAARANGVAFFPILVGREEESWMEASSALLEALTAATYTGDYEERKEREFIANLEGRN